MSLQMIRRWTALGAAVVAVVAVLVPAPAPASAAQAAGLEEVTGFGTNPGTPTATAVADLASFSSGSRVSTDFSPGGLGAINRTGTTQLKLRFEQPPTSTAYRFLQSGTGTALTIVYG